MIAKFEELPESARVWIYQADKLFTDEQERFIESRATEFCNQWAAHGTPLASSFKVLHGKFLVLAVDEGVNMASGCSIDSSVHFIKSLEQNLQVNFFDRTQVAFLINDQIFTTALQEIKSEIDNGKIGEETLTFNLQAQNLGEFNENWLVPAGASWMKRYF
jgi:hypothetical protein